MNQKLSQIDFSSVKEFEDKISNFFGSPYAVAVDSCTHGIELCLRYTNEKKINVPKRTYISVPFLAKKLGLELEWKDEIWQNYYTLNYIDIIAEGTVDEKIVKALRTKVDIATQIMGEELKEWI